MTLSSLENKTCKLEDKNNYTKDVTKVSTIFGIKN